MGQTKVLEIRWLAQINEMGLNQTGQAIAKVSVQDTTMLAAGHLPTELSGLNALLLWDGCWT